MVSRPRSLTGPTCWPQVRSFWTHAELTVAAQPFGVRKMILVASRSIFFALQPGEDVFANAPAAGRNLFLYGTCS